MSSPGDSRYTALLEQLVARLDPITPGIGLIVVPSRQQEEIAAWLASKLAAEVVDLEHAAALTPPASRVLVAGLPREGVRAAKLLAELNGRRNFTAAQGRLIVLLVSPFELVQVQAHAPDSYSALRFLEDVSFVPDLDVEEGAARASLGRYYRERFGRLDLRGFIRSETEDVSFSVEEIFQDIQASLINPKPSNTPIAESDGDLVSWLKRLSWHRPFVVLGHPGSGKSFLLRWLALNLSKEADPLELRVDAPLPFLVSLAAYAQAPEPIGLLDYLTQILLDAGEPVAHLIEKAASACRAVFLLDGLDEAGDETAHPRILKAVVQLHERVPGCLLVMTSRIAGYEADALDAHHFMLSPFSDEGIRRFLVRWCELYEAARLGASDGVRRRGREEGKQLAKDVLGNPGVSALARNPLLLTVLAIVHRAGVRLPDHRVELYAHATRVLVERWNRVRSLAGGGAAPPLKAVDAVRLLGPLALKMMRGGSSAVVEEGALRTHIQRALSAGTLRGVTSADEVISLFRDALGLLVEQAPGVYGFLHLTLAEYFAAWELVRSDELERLAADPTRAYLGQYREVLLLAAGELGVNRGDDARLAEMVTALLDSAVQRKGRPSPTVPSVLAGLLADDPHLTVDSARRIIDQLIPKWWFGRSYRRKTSLLVAVREAAQVLEDRLMGGRFGHLLHAAAQQAYGSGFPSNPSVLLNLTRGGPAVLGTFLHFLAAAGVDYGPHILIYGSSLKRDLAARALDAVSLPLRVTGIDADSGTVRGRFRVSRHLDEKVRSGALQIDLSCKLIGRRIRGGMGPLISAFHATIPWGQTTRVGELTEGEGEVTLEVVLWKPSEGSNPEWGSVGLKLRPPAIDGDGR